MRHHIWEDHDRNEDRVHEIATHNEPWKKKETKHLGNLQTSIISRPLYAASPPTRERHK